MNLILLKEQDYTGPDQAELAAPDPRFQHICQVLRARKGDSLACGLLNGKMGQGKLISLTDSRVLIQTRLTQEPPPCSEIVLVLALPRPKMLKRIIQTVASLGIKQIHLVNSWRVEKSFWDSPFLASGGLTPYMIAGLEQAKDTVLPYIVQHRFFSSFVQKTLPAICAGKTGLIAHPRGAASCPFHMKTPVVLAIGPEGGFIDQEIASLENQGMNCVNVGHRILRVETAVTLLIGRLGNASQKL